MYEYTLVETVEGPETYERTEPWEIGRYISFLAARAALGMLSGTGGFSKVVYDDRNDVHFIYRKFGRYGEMREYIKIVHLP